MHCFQKKKQTTSKQDAVLARKRLKHLYRNGNHENADF
ncbi:hypothetical protein [Photorhabdus sp. CRCIA-P01]